MAMGKTRIMRGVAEHLKDTHESTVWPERAARGGVYTSLASTLLTILKYLIALTLVGLAFWVVRGRRYAVAAMLELLAVFVLSEWLAEKNRLVANLVNDVLMLAFMVQEAVLIFATSFVTPLMLSNLFNLEDLAGNAVLYGVAALAAVLVSLIPIGALRTDGAAVGAARRAERNLQTAGLKFPAVSGVVVTCELVAALMVGSQYAPLLSSVQLARDWQSYQALKAQVSAVSLNPDSAEYEQALQQFYRDGVAGAYDKPATLPDQPNVIVIFTEGLSQNIIDDERAIMPNVRRYQEASLEFTRYYNHTAATFRGLNGQLYSGYQLDDYDANALVSLQSIMADQGYVTTFINAEPNHAIWCNFIDHMGFDEVVDTSATGSYSIGWGTGGQKMSDGESYATLQQVCEQHGREQQPFLIAMYSFGTHVSLDSPEQKFGDGSDPVLNRFYNCDWQFDQFMRWFENSPLFENTVLVFTADHASYNDLDFAHAFPSYKRHHAFCDEMPLFVYYRGVEHQAIDVAGRTTLDFAPTVLDFLDVSAPNFFLGHSLFISDEPGQEGPLAWQDVYYFDGNTISSSAGGELYYLEGDERTQIEAGIMDYIWVSRIPLDE